MKPIKLSLIVIVFLSCEAGIAQQFPQFTQYMYNTISVNPAYAGSREVLSVVGLHRSQWVGFRDGPTTQTLSIHTPLRNDRVGLGLSFIKDDLGPENFTYLYTDFSYAIPTGPKGRIAFGIKGGFTQYSFDQEVREAESEDPFIFGILDRWTPNIGLGLYWSTNKIYASISVPRILNTTKSADEGFEPLDRLNYYFTLGGVIKVSESLKFKPAGLIKATNGAPISYDVTANFLYREKFWVGASYRINNQTGAIGAIADFQLSKQIRLGYAYEKPLSVISSYTSGTHEVLLIYEFKFLSSKLKSPRYF